MNNRDTRSADPVIELISLSFSWSSGLDPLLKLEQLVIKPGEKLFIEGPSGSGKSTLLGLITGILVPQEGKVLILGNDISAMRGRYRDSFRADHIGYIFQLFNLIPYLSIIENVILPCHFSALRKKRALQQSPTLQDEAFRLLEHLSLMNSELLGKPVIELSVGQQQRVAAARALIGSPSLVIADEPTSSLDVDQRESFLQLLFEECAQSGATLVFVSHDVTLRTLFDRTVDIRLLNKAPDQERG
jgi:putative ABC transport system ATP-binding protein